METPRRRHKRLPPWYPEFLKELRDKMREKGILAEEDSLESKTITVGKLDLPILSKLEENRGGESASVSNSDLSFHRLSTSEEEFLAKYTIPSDALDSVDGLERAGEKEETVSDKTEVMNTTASSLESNYPLSTENDSARTVSNCAEISAEEFLDSVSAFSSPTVSEDDGSVTSLDSYKSIVVSSDSSDTVYEENLDEERGVQTEDADNRQLKELILEELARLAPAPTPEPVHHTPISFSTEIFIFAAIFSTTFLLSSRHLPQSELLRLKNFLSHSLPSFLSDVILPKISTLLEKSFTNLF